MKSSEIKKLFKSINIPVSVRTVKCKYPFTQIWSDTIFPNYIRKAALICDYDLPDNDISSLNVLNTDDINYGNTRPNSLSIPVTAHERFFKLVCGANTNI